MTAKDRMRTDTLLGTAAQIEDDDDEDTPRNEAGGAAQERTSFVDRALVRSRTLMITGPINDALARYVSGRLLIMEAEHPEKPITVFINSPGGSADSGFAIYDMLRFVAPPIRTICNGLCASAAILVLLATEKKNRFSLPESRFLIHQPSTFGMGTASDLDITAREIIKLRERYNKIIAQQTGKAMEKILSDSQRDFWLNAKEASDYGLVHGIVTARSEID
jgi:ATP-dependent Clp protease protease subunit